MELQDTFAFKVTVTIVALIAMYYMLKLSWRYFLNVGRDGFGTWAPMAVGIALGSVLAKLAIMWGF